MNVNNITNLNRGWLEFLNRSTATIAIETSILLLIELIAIGGNLMVVISIYRNPSLRTITNYFVLSLCLADIVYSVIVLPITITLSIKSRFVLGESLCEFHAISLNSLYFVSVLNMAFMAVIRFLKVCKTHKYKYLLKKNISLIIIGTIWTVSFAAITLYSKIGHFTSTGFKPNEIRCGFIYNKLHSTASKIIGNSVLLLGLAIPFTVIAFCYFQVFKKIRQHKKRISSQEIFGLRNIQNSQSSSSVIPKLSQRGRSQNTNNLGTSVQEIKITWTLFAVLLGYCLSWLPVLIVSSLSRIVGEHNIPRQVHLIVIFTGSSSCAINPIIYGAMNPAFRQEYKKILGIIRIS